MKFYTLKLKELYPQLNTLQEPTLDCYIPDRATAFDKERKAPAMIICPGGGYGCICDDREGDPIAHKYLSEGFNCFVLKYSVAPARYPEALTELASAVKYVRDNCEELHIDTNKIAVTGFSAGGHLAASLCTLYKSEEVCSVLGVAPEYIRPDAAVLAYPVLSAKPEISHLGSIINLTGTEDTNNGLFKKMSLEDAVDAQTPPAFIFHTSDDQMVNVRQSIAYATSLVKNNVPAEIHIYPHGPHGMATANHATFKEYFSPLFYSRPWMDESVKFMFNLWKEKQ